MKFNYKKIASVLAVTAMLGSTMVGAAWSGSASDYAVVYGAATDLTAATDLASSLTVSATAAMGDESKLLEATGDKLNYGQALDSIKDVLTDKDLPKLLASGTVKDDGDTNSGDEIDYDQEITLSGDSVEFSSLGNEEDYVVNTADASKEMPILNINQDSGEIWTLTVDFDEPLDIAALDDSETLTIAGQKLTVDPDNEEDGVGTDEITLYLSSQTVTAGVGDSKTITVGGQSFTINVLGANTDNDDATIEINGKTKQVSKGETVTVDDQKFYVNEIFMQTVPTGSAAVEIFAGAKEVVFLEDHTSTVQIDGEDVDGLEATVDGEINAVDSIAFTFTPSDLSSDNNQQDYLEIGETVADPLFGIAMTFDAVNPELKSSDNEEIRLVRSGKKLQVDFVNKDGDAYSIQPYESDGASAIVDGNNWFDSTDDFYDIVEDENIIILQEGSFDDGVFSDLGDITKVLQVKSIKAGTDNEVQFKDLSDGSTFIVKDGKEILSTDSYVDIIDGDSFDITGEDAVDRRLFTENGIAIDLETAGDDEIAFAEDYDGKHINEGDVTASDITIDVQYDADEDLSLTGLTVSDGSAVESDNDGDVDYALSEYGTYIELEADKQGAYMNMYVPAEENNYDVYISSGAMASTSTSAVPVSASAVDSVKGKNLLVVGGSCINTVAANLLTGNAAPLCGSAFSTVTGVDAGEYLIQVFASPYTDGKVAVLIAGYEADQTTQAVNAFQEGNVAMTAGTKVTGPTLA